jgi:hypothetical protein
MPGSAAEAATWQEMRARAAPARSGAKVESGAWPILANSAILELRRL